MSCEHEEEVPSTGNTPTRSTRGVTATKLISKPLENDDCIDTDNAQSSKANGSALVRSQSVHFDEGDANEPAGAAHPVPGIGLSVASTAMTYLQDIDSFIAKEGLASTLEQFPEPVEYTFAISDNKTHFLDKKLLFLGETNSFQAWARLKSYPIKPDEVEFLHFSFLSNTSSVRQNIATLPINIYPFSIIAEKGSDGAKEQLTVLVRCVFREAAGINQPFSMEAKQILKSALLVIQDAIKTAGGADKLLNIRSPAKVPNGLTYVETIPSAKADKSANLIVDQSSNLETEIRRWSEFPPERKVFQVPAPPKAQKPVKTKIQPASQPKPKSKPKPELMASAKKTVPVKRRASRVGDEDAAQYSQLKDLWDEREDIEREKTEISHRQAERKREEDSDKRRMAALSTRERILDRDEGRLLEGKSARWLLAYQRGHTKE